MPSLLKSVSGINFAKAKRLTLVLVAYNEHKAGHPCALFVQREKDDNQALTLLQGEFSPRTESYEFAAARILQNHFEMPPHAAADSPMIKHIGMPLGYFVHKLPDERKKGAERTNIYLPLRVSLRVRLPKTPKHQNPAKSFAWMLGRDIDAHASLMGSMRDAEKWLAHVEALTEVLRPAAKQRVSMAA